ncbi:MAG: hypothetical protein ACLRR4_07570 [Blautia sp.]
MTWKNEKKSKALLVVFGIYLALLVWCILFKFASAPGRNSAPAGD